MSADADRVPGLLRLGEDDQGRTMMAMPYSEKLAAAAVENGLAQKTQVEPEPSDREGTTPDPESADDDYNKDSGPIRRFNDVFTDLGSVQLEALGLDGHEVANATMTLRNEMYRSQFPVIQPRFSVKCVDEECEAEYDQEIGFCLECARVEMIEAGVENPPTDPDRIPEEYQDHDVRQPNPREKREAQQLAESVNKEGQSLRELMKMLEDDQSRIGVSTLVAKKKYAIAEGDTGIYDRGEVIWEDTDELVRGDPKRVVPVVDENGRVGNHWWTCPVHRRDARTEQVEYEEEGKRWCDHCGAELREVYFVETENTGRYSRTDRIEKLYFADEVVTWARYFPRLHGLDGLSPLHHVWLKQAILHWMDIYGAAFYDPDSERYPNKFMVVHTTNPKAWEKQFDKAEEDAKENPYSEQVMFNEYSSESNSTPEVQVIDLMSDELLGQDQQIRDQYKQDIRTQFGVTNVFDSELKDAGGLNNEGLQMEVTDRTIASAMHDTVAGPLDEIAKVLGIDDYLFEFVPPQDTDIEELRQEIEVGQKATSAGLDARLEDDKVEIADGDFEEDEAEEGGGGLAGLFGDFDGEEPLAAEKAVGDDHWSEQARTFRLVPAQGEEDDYNDDILGVGIDFPEAGVYVDWHREAFPDALDEPHVSEYGTIGDLKKATGNDIVDYNPPPGARLSDEKADPMANGHDLDPATGVGTCSSTGKTIEAETMGDLTEDCPHCGDPLSVISEKANRRVMFGNVGGDPFYDQDTLESFLDDLDEAAEGAVLIGDSAWPSDDYAIHDRPVEVRSIDPDEADEIWADYEDEAVALGGPRTDGKARDAGGDEPWRHEGTDKTPARESGEKENERSRRVWDVDLGEGEEGKADGGEGLSLKRRVYVDDPSEVPEDAELQEGEQGGVYYETGGGLSEGVMQAVANLPPERQTQLARMLPKVSEKVGKQLLKATAKFGPQVMTAVARSGPQVLDALVKVVGDELEGPEDTKGYDEEKARQVSKLDDAFRHIVWADETTKAEPFWDGDDAIPEFVQEIIASVIEDSVWSDFESIPGALQERMQDILAENLTQPQGWSLESITEDISNSFGADYESAQLVARTETASVLNDAREEGYRQAGVIGGDEEAMFRWAGPLDHRTTDCCKWLEDKTAGGVTYERLLELEEEAVEEYFPNLEFRKHVPHPNCRHTFVETFKMDHAGAAGPIEVEYKLDWAPAMAAAGTFEVVA